MNDDDDAVPKKFNPKSTEFGAKFGVIKEIEQNASEMLTTNDLSKFHRDTKYDFSVKLPKAIRLAKPLFKHKRIIVQRFFLIEI